MARESCRKGREVSRSFSFSTFGQKQIHPGIHSNIFLCRFMSLMSLYVIRLSKIKQCLGLDDTPLGVYTFSSPNLHCTISVALIKTQKHPAQAASGIHFDKIQRNKSCNHKLYGLSPVTNTSHPTHSFFSFPFYECQRDMLHLQLLFKWQVSFHGQEQPINSNQKHKTHSGDH